MSIDTVLESKSIQWVKENKKKLINEFCNRIKYPKVVNPYTIFMAGTPGAGKTEFSINLINEFIDTTVRIDADEIREIMRTIGYNGENAETFQRAAVKVVNWLYDYSLHENNSQNVLLDGTFAYGNWRENVERSIKHNRKVEIYYLYQDPIIAWDFVKLRHIKNGRYVPKNIFIESYVSSIENVDKAKALFKDNITVYFAINNYLKAVEKIEIDVADIEKLLPKRYSRDELERIIHD